MAEVVLERVTKILGGKPAVKDLSLTVRQGESVCILGPSGCGKTTTLNMIAGFLYPESGRILVGGRPMERTQAHKRNVGMVFQNYALFPHLKVKENVAFGLQMRKVAKSESRDRVRSALELVHLTGFEDRYPKQLSGGEQQRVALARALVIRPAVLLLDEPLSNLDARLRQQMRDEIADIQRKTRVTTIFVTHDQQEALAISDRVAVMQSGELQQFGSPEDVYRRPQSRFVAEFIGDANIFSGDLVGTDGNVLTFAFPGGVMGVGNNSPVGPGRAVVMVRPEHIRVTSSPREGAVNTYAAVHKSTTYLGALWRYQLSVKDQPLLATSTSPPDFPTDANALVYVSWQPADATVIVENGSIEGKTSKNAS